MNTAARYRNPKLAALTGLPTLWLADCEANGYTYDYASTKRQIIQCKALGAKVAVISDLHMGSGIQFDASFTGCENFYSDDAFGRFLNYLHKTTPAGKNTTLIINGDFIDFLRIVDMPSSNGDFEIWKNDLDAIGYQPQIRITDLQDSIRSKSEAKYGLKTNDYKSVWKLRIARIGHALVFTSLAEWLANGHELFITKGNHDLEWYWLPVRNALRSILARDIESRSQHSYEDALKIVFDNVRFFDHAIELNENTYIEHGHLYDKFTTPMPDGQDELIVKGKPTGEINLPAGSFFNRYLVNKLEERFPYMNNVRPRTSFLPMLIKTDFPLALRVFFTYIPKLLKSMRRRYYGALLMQSLMLAICIFVPLAVVIVEWGKEIMPVINGLFSSSTTTTNGGLWATIQSKLIAMFETGAGLVASYFLARLLSYLQLDEPSSLLDNAKPFLSTYDNVTMGHTHDPEQFEMFPGRWFFNTGTWIPIIEADSAAVREDKTYTFLSFTANDNGLLQGLPLLRWNDDAAMAEQLVLVRTDDKERSKWREVKQSNFVKRLRFGFAMP